MSCGVFVVCALAAQDKGAQAGEAVANGTNCALRNHRPFKYTYRSAERKHFFEKIRERGIASVLPAKSLKSDGRRRSYNR